MSNRNAGITLLLLAAAAAGAPGPWTAPVEVRHNDDLCLVYRARLDGDYLVVQASIQPGWHTFSMDNRQRVEEKLAGRKSLGIDHPTEFTLTGGMGLAGPWYQTPPEDFSKPELRWFSWGFERQALFAARVRRTGAAPVEMGVRGQACTDTVCKNIDLTVSIPTPQTVRPPASDVNLSALVRVRER